MLLVLEGLLGVLRGEEIKIGPAHERGRLHPVSARQCAVDGDEPRLRILEIHVVGHAVHEHAQQVLLLRERALDLAAGLVFGLLAHDALHGERQALHALLEDVIGRPGAHGFDGAFLAKRAGEKD